MLLLILCPGARAQGLVWYDSHARIYRPLYGFWAQSGSLDQSGCYTLRVNLLLDDDYCMTVSRPGSFGVQVQNKRTGETKWIPDCGIMVREGATVAGWKENLYSIGPVTVAWNDDEQLRITTHSRCPNVTTPIPTRVVMYVPMDQVIGGTRSWEVLTVAPLKNMTEVKRCGK